MIVGAGTLERGPAVPARPGREMASPGPANSWKEHAACRGKPRDWWHPREAGSGAHHAYGLARAVCMACPVRLDCLAYAIEMESHVRAERQGMWGGTTPAERHRYAEWLRGWDRCGHCDARYRGRWGAWCGDECAVEGRRVLREGRNAT